MNTILFECDVMEYDIIPNEKNNENCFAINENSLIINLMSGTEILMNTEISKKDAIELAKLILFKYND
jgi:hypothetical protein